MDIEGTYTLQAPAEAVTAFLMDSQALQRTIPGIERLEVVGEHTYAFTLHIKHAPLRGSYSGQAVVVEQQYPLSYRVTLEGDGQPGKLQSEWTVELRAHNENTVVAYKGTLHLAKASTLLPEPLVKGTLKVLIQQFFISLADHLRTASHMYTTAPEQETHALAELEQENNGRITIPSYPGQHALLHSIVRQLGLGSNDPVLEELWVTRLRRIGIISMLLLLVWIGTRLPRKPTTRP